MGFTVFKTPKPKGFKYTPRYYDPKKEALERRKAELGIDSKLSHHEQLRSRMSNRWNKEEDDQRSILSRTVSYLIYGTVIALSIYFILFTNIIETILSSFGVTQ